MAYTQTTQTQFIAELAVALGDSSLIFWSSDELARALHEALLLWGALTSYWVTSSTFNTVASTAFYNLSVECPTYRRRDYTFEDLTTEIQHHLLEPQAAGVPGTGMTSQFTVSQITAALKRRRNQFVIDSHLPLTTTTVSPGSPPDNTIDLPQDLAVIDRAAWKVTSTGVYSPLSRTDPYAAQAFSPLWSLNPGKPYAYSQAESMPLAMVLVPPPLVAGSAHLIYAQTLDLTVANGTSFAVPDEFAHAIKWGALYDLLSTNNPGYDPLRAAYCLERYQATLTAAAMARSMLRVRINSSPVPLATIAEIDDGKPSWQTGTGTPTTAAAAYDLLTFYRVPNGVYQIGVDLVQAAPIPASGSTAIQMGREELPYLYDYCRHILSWKMGGAEFVSTMPLYDNFLAGAARRNKLLETKARYLTSLFQRADLTDQLVA
jgi:hypothetical protein